MCPVVCFDEVPSFEKRPTFAALWNLFAEHGAVFLLREPMVLGVPVQLRKNHE
jgi:hypothetical protein